MNSEKIKETLEEELSKCVRCGACKYLCPVYQVENTEESSPRGKNSLLLHLLEGDYVAGELSDYLTSCTLCEACISGCPNDVHPYRIVILGRSLAKEKSPEKYLYKVFNSNKILSTTEKFLRKLQKQLFLPDSDLYKLRWRIGDVDKYLPPFPDGDFFQKASPLLSLQSDFRKRVLFFVGCLIRYIYPDTGIHLVEILNTLGWGVIVPQEQICCGLPALSSGFMDDFIESLRKNIEIFSKYSDIEFIISACGSCENTLKNYYTEFAPEDIAEKVKDFSGKIIDFSEFLIKEAKVNESFFNKDKRVVTYHDSCHLNRGMGVREEPRLLLKSAGNFKEMPEADLCCGFGGSFSIKEYESSQKILQRKMKDADEIAPDLLVAGCPGCVLQLGEGSVKYSSGEIKVKHIVDYLYEVIVPK